MNSTANTFKITVNAGSGKNTKTFNVPASRWEEFVAFTKATCIEDGITAIITVTSERRGVIYAGVAA
jgi:hypothetical protein